MFVEVLWHLCVNNFGLIFIYSSEIVQKLFYMRFPEIKSLVLPKQRFPEKQQFVYS